MSIILQIWANFYVISLQVLIKKKQNTERIYQKITRSFTAILLIDFEFQHFLI